MAAGWEPPLNRWTEAGVIDAETAAKIRAFEANRAQASGLRWPIIIALAFGALMAAAGVLLFVSAHWDTLSPGEQFGLVLAMVAVFHVSAVAFGGRSLALATTLHAVGTVAMGAGIFLGGQIFNLSEHWPAGFMLWALGAGLGWLLLRDLPQFALTAMLVPIWLSAEWFDHTRWFWSSRDERVGAAGLFLIALAYFTAPTQQRNDPLRRTLQWIGGIALLPASLFLVDAQNAVVPGAPSLSTGTLMIGWAIAIGVPLGVALVTRRSAAWTLAASVVWVLVLVNLRWMAGVLPLYAWWGVGAIALVAWGLREGRSERINMGAVVFASTVLAFYFSQIMTKLGRSASLIGLGILFLAGGWALERTRRRLVQQSRGGES